MLPPARSSGTATVGLEPDAVAVTPSGTLALVANFGDNTVTPLSLPSLRPGRPIAVGRQPVAVAISPKGNLALVSDYQDGTISPITLPGLTVGTPGPGGAGTHRSLHHSRRWRRPGR